MFFAEDCVLQDSACAGDFVVLGQALPVPAPPADIRKHPLRVFSDLQSLFSAKRLQPMHAHSVAHSLRDDKDLNVVFPVTSPLPAPSLAPERKSTPLFSTDYTLFRKNTQGRG